MRKHIFIALLFLLSNSLHAQKIITVAGGGLHSDGWPATIASLDGPHGITLDDSGNLYICDLENAKVRKVRPSFGGIISTVAGNGTSGYSGDGGLATNASLNGVQDIAIGNNGNIYIVNQPAHRIRKIATNGIISTIAGTGVAGYNGDGIQATNAQLNYPQGLAVDDTGNIYITDSRNFRLRKIDTAGVITTIAGTGVQGFSTDGDIATAAKLDSLYGIRLGRSNTIYFTDNIRIRCINPDGTIQTLAGTGIPGNTGDGGPATNANIIPGVLALDTSDNIYLCNHGYHTIRKVDHSTGIISTIAGTGMGGYSVDGGHPLSTQLKVPAGMVVNSDGDIFFSDMGTNRVRVITEKEVSTVNSEKVPINIEINPNPTRTSCSIQVISQYSNSLLLYVTDIQGKEITRLSDYTNCNFTLFTHWPSGVYILHVCVGEYHQIKKLAIE